MASRIEQAKEILPEEEVNALSEIDPSNNNKYLVWMARQKKIGHSIEDITGTVQSFHRRKDSLKHSDIYKYEDLKTLENEILALNPSKAEKKDISKLKSGADYFCILDNEACTVYSVHSYRGMRSLGKGTKWCIAANANYWKSYSKNNNLFVIQSKLDVTNKFCLLIPRTPHGNEYSIYDEHDQWYCVDDIIAPELRSLILDKTKIISAIVNGEQVSVEQYKLSLPLNNGYTESRLDETISYVKSNNLYHLIPFSYNEKLLLALKKDLPKALGKVKISSEMSSQFLKHCSDLIEEKSIEDYILSNVCSKLFLKSKKSYIDLISDSDFRNLIKNCKFKSTKKGLINMRPQHIDCLSKDDMNITLARLAIKQLEEKALPLIYHLYDKVKYNYDYYSGRRSTYPLRPSIDKLIKKANKETIDSILKQKDCPASLKKVLLKTKKKELPKDKATEVNSILELVYDNKKALTLEQVKDLIGSITV